MSEFDEYQEWLEEVIAEDRREAATNHPLVDLTLREFESRSNGRGRKPRRWSRGVSLLVRERSGRGPVVYQVIGGEIRPRKKRDCASRPDQLANEVLDWLPEDERTADRLLAEIIRRGGKIYQ